MGNKFVAISIIWFVFGFLSILFCDKLGIWNSVIRNWIAKRFPFWAKMSGLPEEKLQYYLSKEFGRKQAILSGVILIILGIIFTLLTLLGIL